MGTGLPFVNLAGQAASALATGYISTCALLTSGKVQCWGSGGVLGFGGVDGYGNAPGTMGVNLPFVDLGTNKTATHIAAGTYHTCPILTGGKVKCWGTCRTPPVRLTPWARFQRRWRAWFRRRARPRRCARADGRRAPLCQVGHRPIGLVDYWRRCIHLLLTDGQKCWGLNADGNLGLGLAVASLGGAPGEMGDALPFVDVGVTSPTSRPTRVPSAAASGQASAPLLLAVCALVVRFTCRD